MEKNFKVGDSVRVITDSWPVLLKGSIGKIIGIENDMLVAHFSNGLELSILISATDKYDII